MRRSMRSAVLAAAALLLVSVARADLKSFIAKPEPAYSWKLVDTVKSDGLTIYKLHLVSQVWHGFKWEHDLALFRPDHPKHPEFCGIRNTGGTYGGDGVTYGMALAKQSGMNFAVLWGVPMQPIWGKDEDALIVATWQKYVETRDPSWPLHFPMAKSVIKSMDALQAFSAKNLKAPIKRFVINGSSKRGWTTWLVGASQDPRVVAIAPAVIDVLKVAVQIPHQIKMLNGASEEIEDYTKSGFLDLLKSKVGADLMKLEDPYSYLDKLTLPKLLLLGTNDQYWAQDALNIYWKDLKGPKWVLYDPNSGHGLEDRVRVYATLSAFLRCTAAHKTWPQITWKHTGPASAPKLAIESNIAPIAGRIWRVESATTDFRASKWSSTEVPVRGKKKGVVALQPAPAGAFAATYVELTYNVDGKPFNVSTQLRILPQTK